MKSRIPFLLLFTLLAGIPAWGNQYHFFEENGKVGLKNDVGEIVLPANFENLGWTDGHTHPVGGVIGYKKNNGWGLVSLKNKYLTAANYHDLYPVEEKFVLASRMGKFSNHLLFGILDFDGTAKVSFRYQSITPIKNDLLLVIEKTGGLFKTGIISEKDIPVLPVEFRDLTFDERGYIVVRTFGDKVGLFSLGGKELIAPKFNNITFPFPGYAMVDLHGNKGLYDLSGNIVEQVQYKDIILTESGERQPIPFHSWDLKDQENVTIATFSSDSINPVSEDLYLVYRNGIGLLENVSSDHVFSFENQEIVHLNDRFLITRGDKDYQLFKWNGEPFLEGNYDSVAFDGEYLFVKSFRKENPWDIYSKYGSKISKFGYERVRASSEGYIPVMRSGYWGVIDFSGEIVLRCKFDSVRDYTNKRVLLKFHDTWGLADNFGEWVILPFEDSLKKIGDSTYISIKGRHIKLFDWNGRLLNRTTEVVEIRDFGILIKDDTAKVGYMNFSGELITAVAYDEIKPIYGSDLIYARIGNYIGILDRSGQVVIPMQEHYQDIIGISHAYIGIKKDDKFGFIDQRGLLRISNRYDSVMLFADSLAAVQINGGWGFVDMWERLVVQPNYDEVGYYISGVCIVNYQGKYGLIDKEANVLIDYKYDKIERTPFGHFIVYEGEKAGLVNQLGQLIVYPKFDHIIDLENEQLLVNSNGKWGVMKNDGNYLIPTLFKSVIYDEVNNRFITRKD